MELADEDDSASGEASVVSVDSAALAPTCETGPVMVVSGTKTDVMYIEPSSKETVLGAAPDTIVVAAAGLLSLHGRSEEVCVGWEWCPATAVDRDMMSSNRVVVGSRKTPA